MRRLLPVLLALLLALAACGSREADVQETLDFYYLDSAEGEESLGSDNGALAVERRRLSQLPATYGELLDVYFAGPVSAGLQSPFPAGLRCLETSLDETVLTVILSEVFDSLTGLDRSLASACIVCTLSQLPEVTGICLETEADVGADREARVYTAADFVSEDLSYDSTETTVRLYFADANGRYLVTAERSRYFSDAEEIPRFVVEQLLAGPTEEGQLAVMPEGTTLLDIALDDDGVCTVNLSSEFVYNKPDTGLLERMAVLSLVNSLTELEPIKAVRILVEGETVGPYLNMDLDRDLVRDPSALDVVREGLDEVDATLYVRGCQNTRLAPVPVSVRQLAQVPIQESLMEQLTAFTEINGLTNPLPEGTALQWAQMYGNVCRVDLSQQLLACAGSAVEEQLAIQAVAATLLSLDGVDGVQISVNGRSDGFRYYTLNRIYTADDLWPA